MPECYLSCSALLGAGPWARAKPCLDIRAVGVQEEGCIVRVLGPPGTGRTVVGSTGAETGNVKAIHGLLGARNEGDVDWLDGAIGRGGDYEEGSLGTRSEHQPAALADLVLAEEGVAEGSSAAW